MPHKQPAWILLQLRIETVGKILDTFNQEECAETSPQRDVFPIRYPSSLARMVRRFRTMSYWWSRRRFASPRDLLHCSEKSDG